MNQGDAMAGKNHTLDEARWDLEEARKPIGTRGERHAEASDAGQR